MHLYIEDEKILRLKFLEIINLLEYFSKDKRYCDHRFAELLGEKICVNCRLKLQEIEDNEL